jgi:hypothetical protein
MHTVSPRHPRGSSWLSVGASLLVAFGLSGCANGIRLYDEPRSRLATSIKEGYGNASVLSTIEVEKRNLDRLLEEELKVVRDNQQLRVDFALLRIADDSTPMAVTWIDRMLPRLVELGYPSVKAARASVIAEAEKEVFKERLASFARNVTNFAPRVEVPRCTTANMPPETLVIPSTVTDENRERALHFYGLYRKRCLELLAAEPTSPGGLAGQALGVWRSASADVEALDREIDAAQKAVAEKRAARDAAAKAASDAAAAGAAMTTELREKAAAAAQALTDAQRLPGFAKDRLSALVTLLTAAAGGTIDSKDPDVTAAAAVAASIPSLAGDAKNVQAGKTPSVNNLLIELRHHVVLLERAQRLRSLAQQRADLARAQYEAVRTEAELWVRFSDAMCSLAVVAGGTRSWPGQKCDDFKIVTTPDAAEPTGRKLTCELTELKLEPGCLVVTRRWNQVIREFGTDKDLATRELWKGLGAFFQALAAEGTQHELTFRLIDVRHRETLVSREAALRGWDNLVTVPIDQLDAYYRAGLKPAEIADLLVKALGFGAIAYGVSR